MRDYMIVEKDGTKMSLTEWFRQQIKIEVAAQLKEVIEKHEAADLSGSEGSHRMHLNKMPTLCPGKGK